MNTLEMIKDWKENNCKSKYIRVDSRDSEPYTVYNNGFGVLFQSYYVITLGDNFKKTKPFLITDENLNWEWQQIIEEFSIEQAYKMISNGACMISLESGKILEEKGIYSKSDILGKWIEKIK